MTLPDPFRPWRDRLTPLTSETVLRLAAMVLYMAVIFAFSSIPGRDLPSNIDDRIAHFSEYFGFSFALLLAAVAIVPKVRMRFLLSTIAGILYAATDEFHQAFVPGRTPDVKDLAFDSLGLISALVLLGIFTSRRWRRG